MVRKFIIGVAVGIFLYCELKSLLQFIERKEKSYDLLGVIVGSTVAIVICCRLVYFIPGKFKKNLKIRKLNYKLV